MKELVIVVGDAPIRHDGRFYRKGESLNVDSRDVQRMVDRGHVARPATIAQASRDALTAQIATALDVATTNLAQEQSLNALLPSEAVLAPGAEADGVAGAATEAGGDGDGDAAPATEAITEQAAAPEAKSTPPKTAPPKTASPKTTPPKPRGGKART